MCTRRERGITLIEQIMFIVIVGAAVAGVLGAISYSSRASVDPMVQKQALAIAEAVLEEVQLQPFTYCDPDDANAATANGVADCTGGPGGANDESKTPLGREAGEDRYSTTTPLDNVSDYNLFASNVAEPASGLTGIRNINSGLIDGLDAYTVSVSVATQGIAAFGGKPAISTNEALLITVTVTGPSTTTVVLDGYRTRYAPNALP